MSKNLWKIQSYSIVMLTNSESKSQVRVYYSLTVSYMQKVRNWNLKDHAGRFIISIVGMSGQYRMLEFRPISCICRGLQFIFLAGKPIVNHFHQQKWSILNGFKMIFNRTKAEGWKPVWWKNVDFLQSLVTEHWDCLQHAWGPKYSHKGILPCGTHCE